MTYWGASWAGRVNNYIKSPAVYHCPDDPTVPAGSAVTSVALSYNYNRSLVFNIPAFPGPGGHLSGFNSPAKTVLLCEISGDPVDVAADMIPANDPNINQSIGLNGVWERYFNNTNVNIQFETGTLGNRTPQSSGGINEYGNYTDPTTKGRHSDGSNFLLCDGHVKWYRGSQVSSGFNAKNSTDPQDNLADDGAALAAGTEDSTNKYSITFSAY